MLRVYEDQTSSGGFFAGEHPNHHFGPKVWTAEGDRVELNPLLHLIFPGPETWLGAKVMIVSL